MMRTADSSSRVTLPLPPSLTLYRVGRHYWLITMLCSLETKSGFRILLNRQPSPNDGSWHSLPHPSFLFSSVPSRNCSGELNSRFQADLHRAAHCASPGSSRTYCLSCEPWGYFWKPECQNKLASCVRPGADGSLTSCSLALISHFEALNVRSSINIFIIAFLLCSYLGYRCVGANIPFLLFLKKKNINQNDKFLHL